MLLGARSLGRLVRAEIDCLQRDFANAPTLTRGAHRRHAAEGWQRHDHIHDPIRPDEHARPQFGRRLRRPVRWNRPRHNREQWRRFASQRRSRQRRLVNNGGVETIADGSDIGTTVNSGGQRDIAGSRENPALRLADLRRVFGTLTQEPGRAPNRIPMSGGSAWLLSPAADGPSLNQPRKRPPPRRKQRCRVPIHLSRIILVAPSEPSLQIRHLRRCRIAS
jgi:hypothetical protein